MNISISSVMERVVLEDSSAVLCKAVVPLESSEVKDEEWAVVTYRPQYGTVVDVKIYMTLEAATREFLATD